MRHAGPLCEDRAETPSGMTSLNWNFSVFWVEWEVGGGCLPENFLWSQTLKVSAHRIKALECSLHTQRAENILWAHSVKVKGDASDVLPSAWLVAGWRFEHDRTLADRTQNTEHLNSLLKAHLSTFILIERTGCGLHACPGCRAMSVVLSGRVMRKSSESTSVPSSSQTRDTDTADRENSRAWQTYSIHFSGLMPE